METATHPRFAVQKALEIKTFGALNVRRCAAVWPSPPSACAPDGAAAFRAVLLPVAAGCKGLSASVAEPCALPVNVGIECLVGGQNRPPEILAQQRIGNRLHAHAALAIVQRQTVATVVVGAQPPDQSVAACPLGGCQALDLIQPFSPLSPSHS